MLNPKISEMSVYPMDRKRELFAPLTRPIVADLTIGEPQHAPDPKVVEILNHYAASAIARYPRTKQEDFLTEAIISANISTKKLSGSIHPDQLLAGCGSGELLYSIAGAMISPDKPYVLLPNPAYQVYRIATEFAGGIPYFFNLLPENNFQPDLSAIPEEVLQKTSLCYLNNPNNPCAVSYAESTLKDAITLAKRFGFVLASDECYIDIYSREKPLSALEVSASMDGDNSFSNVLVFDTLSKRSSLPGLRSGTMIGDKALVSAYLKMRLSERKVLPHHVQRASAFAWTNLDDVANNRRLYAEKLRGMGEILSAAGWSNNTPTSTFYGWLDVSAVSRDDEAFALAMAEATGVLTFPGSYFSTEAHGKNPGVGFIRVALIDTVDRTNQAMSLITDFYSSELSKK